MIPYIPPKLAPWIDFRDDTVHLKPGAPEDVRPLFEKLKKDLKDADDHTLQMK